MSKLNKWPKVTRLFSSIKHYSDCEQLENMHNIMQVCCTILSAHTHDIIHSPYTGLCLLINKLGMLSQLSCRQSSRPWERRGYKMHAGLLMTLLRPRLIFCMPQVVCCKNNYAFSTSLHIHRHCKCGGKYTVCIMHTGGGFLHV